MKKAYTALLTPVAHGVNEFLRWPHVLKEPRWTDLTRLATLAWLAKTIPYWKTRQHSSRRLFSLFRPQRPAAIHRHQNEKSHSFSFLFPASLVYHFIIFKVAVIPVGFFCFHSCSFNFFYFFRIYFYSRSSRKKKILFFLGRIYNFNASNHSFFHFYRYV